MIAAVSSERKILFWRYSNISRPVMVGVIDVLMNCINRLEQADLWVTCGANPACCKLWQFKDSQIHQHPLGVDHTKQIVYVAWVDIL